MMPERTIEADNIHSLAALKRYHADALKRSGRDPEGAPYVFDMWVCKKLEEMGVPHESGEVWNLIRTLSPIINAACRGGEVSAEEAVEIVARAYESLIVDWREQPAADHPFPSRKL